MIDQQTLITVLSVLAGFIGVAGYLRLVKRDLAMQITGFESRMTDRIDLFEARLSVRIDDLEANVGGRPNP